ncbi:lambda-crystallin homolog isoform X3 [Octopus sinensis]|uniref:Lambda-crystallin homolog isoform X3 n=1 Tax=Octopus sinensis TaxID=2607531 RepID=A0A7E6ELD5_9MOLL|nr:lambda-crystallin homolog isoform X3 [Octopus sinensis]
MASEKTQLKEEKVAIIGSGFIGCSWAMLFAASGYKVSMFDVNPDQVANALENILSQLKNLEKLGLLRGTLSVEEQYQRISKTVTLESCVTGAVYVQESVPENLELKKEVLKSIDLYLSNEALLASSASCIVPSKISEELKHRNQMFVAHPVNPPFFAPAVELVPAPWTDSKIMNKAEKIMNEIGQVPIQLKKECDGFLINRIQYAILQASWQIIKECWIMLNDMLIQLTVCKKPFLHQKNLKGLFWNVFRGSSQPKCQCQIWINAVNGETVIWQA